MTKSNFHIHPQNDSDGEGEGSGREDIFFGPTTSESDSAAYRAWFESADRAVRNRVKWVEDECWDHGLNGGLKDEQQLEGQADGAEADGGDEDSSACDCDKELVNAGTLKTTTALLEAAKLLSQQPVPAESDIKQVNGKKVYLMHQIEELKNDILIRPVVSSARAMDMDFLRTLLRFGENPDMLLSQHDFEERIKKHHEKLWNLGKVVPSVRKTAMRIFSMADRFSGPRCETSSRRW